MLYKIENEKLIVTIATKGAELQSLTNKETQLEYLWNGDAKFWAKRSPVLFPIVGSLKNNSYEYKGKKYSLSRHGFARDMQFELASQTNESISFFITDTKETFSNYPFHFKFLIKYSLQQNNLIVEYIIENIGNETMYFSVGAHPAFKIPLVKETSFEDYFLGFNHVENAGQYKLSADGLTQENAVSFLDDTNKLALKKSLFYEDALVFKNLKSDAVAIKSLKTNHGLTMYFSGFPYFGIWNAKDADFICLEPWCGITDNINTSGNLKDKEGINSLQLFATFNKKWKVQVY